MLKYVDTLITFSEVPDEISLCINFSNCPYRCINCHSSYLAQDIGNNLGLSELRYLIDKNKGITCVTFMGGDAKPEYIAKLADWVKKESNLKVAWYSGSSTVPKGFDLTDFDYIKLGSYIEELGPLTKRTTNQKFFKIFHTTKGKNKLIDITYKFWKNETED